MDVSLQIITMYAHKCFNSDLLLVYSSARIIFHTHVGPSVFELLIVIA